MKPVLNANSRIQQKGPKDSRFAELERYQTVLLLQGPSGGFFARLAKRLRSRGVHVERIHLNSADRLFYSWRDGASFNRPFAEWRDYLDAFLIEHGIEAIVLFGQNRAYHSVAREAALARQVDVWVFEEGYIRPGFVTLEKGGVNGDSPLMTCDPRRLPDLPALETPEPFFWPFVRMAILSFVYTATVWATWWRHPHYEHHRPRGIREMLRWMYGLSVRKPWLLIAERKTRTKYLKADRDFFVVVMQVECDPTVQVYSRYRTNRAYLNHVIGSFASHAPPNTCLVVRPHPMERGHANYRPIVEAFSTQYGVQARVQILHEGHMPSLLKRSRGAVTINSTVGLQSLYHLVPTKTLGRCFYNKPGLTDQQALCNFWKRPQAPDPVLMTRFYRHLIATSQVNTSFYADRRIAPRPRHVAGHLPTIRRRIGDTKTQTGFAEKIG